MAVQAPHEIPFAPEGLLRLIGSSGPPMNQRFLWACLFASDDLVMRAIL